MSAKAPVSKAPINKAPEVSTGERRRMLVVGAGVETVPGIRTLQGLGLHVVVTDRDANAPGFRVADEAHVASTYDVEATLAAARAAAPLDGVMCIATDVPLTVASVADALGLPGIPVNTARLASDKLAMKDAFAAGGVAIPWYSAVSDAKQLAEIVDERGRELVLKPVDSRGARGVLRLAAADDLGWAFDHARSVSPTARVMVEEFLPGPQLSTESIIVDGRVFTAGVSDRNYEHLERWAPWIIEDGGDLPSARGAAQADAVDSLISAAARALGMTTGVLKGDLVLHPERGPMVVEVATRLSGGAFCTLQIPRATGTDPVAAAARLALGEQPEPADLVPSRAVHHSTRYWFPAPGRLVSVEGAREVAARDGIVHLQLFVEPGEQIEAVTDHTRRAGFVVAEGSSASEARERAEAAITGVRFTTSARD